MDSCNETCEDELRVIIHSIFRYSYKTMVSSELGFISHLPSREQRLYLMLNSYFMNGQSYLLVTTAFY
jgi:hypothetical protein